MKGESFVNPESNTGIVVKYLEIDSDNIADISNNYGEIISLFRKIVRLIDEANLQYDNNNDLRQKIDEVTRDVLEKNQSEVNIDSDDVLKLVYRRYSVG